MILRNLITVFLLSSITIISGFSQQISVDVFNHGLSSSGFPLHNAIIGHNDEIVVSCQTGIYILNDSIILDTILHKPNADYFSHRVFKGAFNNYLYSLNGQDIISWTQNGTIVYNTPFIPGSGSNDLFLQLKQLSNGKIIAQTARRTSYILIVDTADFRYFGYVPFRGPQDIREQGISNMGNGKYIITIGSDLDNKVLILDVPNDTLLIRNSIDYTIGSTPYEFITITNDSMVVVSRTDVNYVKNDSVVGFTDFGDNGMIDDYVVSSISPTTGRLVMANWINLAVLDGGITVYNDTNGYNTPFSDPIDWFRLISYGFNSNGIFYIFDVNGDVYKISEAKLVHFENRISQTEVHAFPNPFSDKIMLKSSDLNFSIKQTNLEILDLQGRVLNKRDYSVIVSKSAIEIYLSDKIKDGFYIINALNGNDLIRLKVIKLNN